MSDSVQPHRRQPTRLPHPWDSPGKNTGVGCRFLLQCMRVSHSVMPDSSRPYRLQTTRLLCPWDFPGKSTGVGCHCLLWRECIDANKRKRCRSPQPLQDSAYRRWETSKETWELVARKAGGKLRVYILEAKWIKSERKNNQLSQILPIRQARSLVTKIWKSLVTLIEKQFQWIMGANAWSAWTPTEKGEQE